MSRSVRSALLACIAACSNDPGRATFYEENAQPAPPSALPPAASSTADFFGTDPFAAGQATRDSKVANHPDGNPGNECLGCHVSGGIATNKPWSVAGTVYTKRKGGTPAGPGIEVRINDANGNKIASVFTDSAGNFELDPATLPAIGTGHVGVRNAATKSIMGSSPGGACNTAACHGEGSATGRVSVDPN